MSNTSSATSMRDMDDPPRRSRRPLLIMLLLLAAAIYAWRVAPPAIRAFHEDERVIILSLAGLAAEEAEAALAGNSQPDLTELTKLFTSLWNDDNPRKIVFIRLWERKESLTYEATRVDTDKARAGKDASLGDLGAAEAMRAARMRLRDETWMDATAQMQFLIADQGELTQLLDDAVKAAAQKPTSEDARNELFGTQSQLYAITQGLKKGHPSLVEAIAGMDGVLNALAGEDLKSLKKAAKTSLNVESLLSLALEEHRAVIADRVIDLPNALTTAAPPSLRWPASIWDAAHGHRVLIPLFGVNEEGTKLLPLGFAEVVFYSQTGDLALGLMGKCWPALAAVLVAIILMLPRRRPKARARREVKTYEPPEERGIRW
ncbi:MAG: hypothetical protein ACYC7E_13905 [Armatimonadota bacterium]